MNWLHRNCLRQGPSDELPLAVEDHNVEHYVGSREHVSRHIPCALRHGVAERDAALGGKAEGLGGGVAPDDLHRELIRSARRPRDIGQRTEFELAPARNEDPAGLARAW